MQFLYLSTINNRWLLSYHFLVFFGLSLVSLTLVVSLLLGLKSLMPLRHLRTGLIAAESYTLLLLAWIPSSSPVLTCGIC